LIDENDETVFSGQDDDNTVVSGPGDGDARGSGQDDDTTVVSGPGDGDAAGSGQDDDRTVVSGQRDDASVFDAASPPRDVSVPNYRIIQKVGEGGMGEVYEAEQEEPIRRRVALKVIKMGMDTKEVVARFESERQALALMDHPAIARVFAAGMTDVGQPYFAMEFVKGVPITKYCDSHRLSTRARLELFQKVCEGVQHAHQKGIIHRDLKPSNVLVAVQGDKPEPKIIDFGLAKATAQQLTDHTVFTHHGQMLGTPEYMSPEQADLTGLDIDTRTDVYSLGLLLYELLVGALPFDSKELRKGGFDLIRKKIREDEPSKPSAKVTRLGDASEAAAVQRRTDPAALSKQLRGDLDWIIMKAVEKDRTRRYDSASDLAADISRHLNNHPVLAGPPSTAYRMKKFVARHKVGVAAGSVVLVTLLLGITGTTIGLFRSVRAERMAREQAEAARQVSEFLEGLFAVSDPGESRGNTITAREILDNGRDRIVVDLQDQPLVQARLMTTMGRVYRRLGLYGEARRLHETALAARQSEMGEQTLEVAESRLELGWNLEAIGDYEDALAMYAGALATQREILGPEHPDVARTISSIGKVYNKTRRFEEAKASHELALQIREKSLGGDHIDVSNSLNLLGNVHVAMTDYRGALPYYERALTIREKNLGGDHPRVAVVLGNLANAYWNLGDYNTARPLNARALAIQEKVLGPDHPDLAYALNNTANLLSASGDYAAAKRTHERALEIRQKHLRWDHPELADTYYNLACVSALQGDRTAALLYLNESVRRGFAKTIIFHDSDLASIREDPEYIRIVDELSGRIGRPDTNTTN
jgi:non-specific serine/threonine protein kinase/serine/threonine-protein kinase